VDYPRTYRYALWVNLLGTLVGVAFVAGSAALLYFVVTSREAMMPGLPAAAIGGVALLAGLGIWSIASIVRWKLILTPAAVTVHDVWSTRTLARSDIAGRRLISAQYGQKIIVLCPRDPHARSVKISSYLRTDPVWDAWIAALPDLDAQAARDLEAEVASDPELGPTPEERLARLKAARKLANAANVVTYAVVLWGYLYPRPYQIVLLALAALPWAALFLVAKSRGLLRVDSQRSDPRPTLALAIILPGFVLMLRAILDVGVLDVPRALSYAACLAGLLTWAALMSDVAVRARRWLVLLLFGMGCCYGYGVAVLADTELDQSPGEQFRVGVLSGRVSRGRSTSYHLTLAPWGPRTKPDEVSVSSALYARVQPGSVVCVHRGPGALEISWYVVTLCD
jgi:hypothetical protein